MAILQTTVNTYLWGRTKFELTPNSPTPPELADTYVVRLWAYDHLIYDRIQSVRNWQMRHEDVEDLAQAFRCVRELQDKRIEGETEKNAKGEERRRLLSLAHADMNLDWLSISLSVGRTRRFPELVHVHLYLRQAQHKLGEVRKDSFHKWGEWEEMISARIECTPEDAIKFGTQLREEIGAAEEQRILLGIPEYDPSYYGEEKAKDSNTDA